MPKEVKARQMLCPFKVVGQDYCASVDCMMWRYHERAWGDFSNNGYCGLAGEPKVEREHPFKEETK